MLNVSSKITPSASSETMIRADAASRLSSATLSTRPAGWTVTSIDGAPIDCVPLTVSNIAQRLVGDWQYVNQQRTIRSHNCVNREINEEDGEDC